MMYETGRSAVGCLGMIHMISIRGMFRHRTEPRAPAIGYATRTVRVTVWMFLDVDRRAVVGKFLHVYLHHLVRVV